MEITVVIDDSTLDEPVRKAVAAAVNQEVRKAVDKKINSMTDKIDEAIEKYLDKTFTDEQLKEIISTEAIAQLQQRIRNLTED